MLWLATALAGSLSGTSLPSVGGAFAGPTEPGALGLISQPAAAVRGDGPELVVDLGAVATRYAQQLDNWDAPQINQGTSIQPTLMVSVPLGRFGVGATVHSSWLRSTNYDPKGPQRLYIVESNLAMYELDLLGSAQVTDWLSIGAGARLGLAQYRNVKGLNLAATLNNSLEPDPALPVHDPLFVGTQEIGPLTKLTGSFILGAAFTHDWVQVDLAFRPQWKAGFQGPITIRPSTSLNAELRGQIDLDLKFPAMLTLGARLTPDEKWTLIPVVEWVGWKGASKNQADISNMALVSPDPALDALLEQSGLSQGEFVRSLEGPSNADLGWRDTVNVTVDAAYQVREDVTLRAGAGFSPSAIPTDATTPSNVDFGVLTFKVGGSWRIAQPIQIGVGIERYQGLTRRVHGSPHSLTDPLPGNPVLPNANGTYAFGLWRAGLTLQAFLPEKK